MLEGSGVGALSERALNEASGLAVGLRRAGDGTNGIPRRYYHTNGRSGAALAYTQKREPPGPIVMQLDKLPPFEAI
jgi:hypothetical protein